MKQTILLFFTLSFLLVGCQVVQLTTSTPSTTPLPITLTSQGTLTPAAPSPTAVTLRPSSTPSPEKPTATTTITAKPTVTFPPTRTPTHTLVVSLPRLEMEEKGVIWVSYSMDDIEYLAKVDLDAGKVQMKRFDYCRWGFVPYSSTLLCENKAGDLVIKNPENVIIQTLPINNPIWYQLSSNGKYILFERREESSGEYTIFVYDLEAQTSSVIKTFQEESSQRGWDGYPELSPDGRYFVKKADRVVTLYDEDGERPIDNPLVVTWDAQWSPTTLQFIYGATDIAQEVVPLPNYFYLYDVESGQNQILAKAPDEEILYFWLNPGAWSPDGKRIALETRGSVLCVVEIETREQKCHQVVSANRGYRELAWSPNSEYLAFHTGEPGGMRFGKLAIFSLRDETVIEVMPFYDGMDNIRLFWR